MALTYSATKNNSYEAGSWSSDRYFTYNSISYTQNPGYLGNCSVTSIDSCSMSNANTNGSSSEGYVMDIQIQLNGTWYTIGYITVDGKYSSHQTFSDFNSTASANVKSLMGKHEPTGCRGYVSKGYFHLNGGSKINLSATVALDYTACTAPTSVTVSNSSPVAGTGVTLKWSGAKAGNGMSISKYEIYRATSANGTYTQLSSTTSASATVTAPTSHGSSYYYKVKAISSVKSTYDSALSSVYATVKGYATACSSPTRVYFDSNETVLPNTSKSLKWSGAAAGTSNAITGYQIWRSTSATGTYSLLSSVGIVNNAMVTSPSSNSSYYYKVLAVGTHSGYASGLSSSYATFTTQYSVPSAPTNVCLSSNNVVPNSTVTLSWTSSTPGANNGNLTYYIYRSESSTGNDSALTSTTSTSVSVISRAANGQNYYYSVRAYDSKGNGWSDYSSKVALTTTVGTILPPASLRANATTQQTIAPQSTVVLTWDACISATNNEVIGYEIYRSTSSSGTYSKIATVTDNSYATMSVSTDGQIYYYKVLATGQQANSALSDFVYVKVSLTTDIASMFTLSPYTVIAGNNLEINITSQTTKKHIVNITFGTESLGFELLPDVTNGTVLIPLDWIRQIPNSTSGAASITLNTYDNDVLKGCRTQTFYISVPLNIIPTIETFTSERIDNEVPANWSVYVVGKSAISLTAKDASGAYGSSIAKINISGQGITSVTYNDGVATVTNAPILQTVTVYTATVTDTRGRYATKTITINAYAYSPPTLTVTNYRCNSAGIRASEGIYGYAKAIPSFSSIGEKNSVSISLYYKERDQVGYQFVSDLQPNEGVVFGCGEIEIKNIYDLKYVVIDAVGTKAEIYDYISAAEYVMDFMGGGKGFSVGGPSVLSNTFDVYWDANFRGDLIVEDVDVTSVLQMHADTLVEHQEAIAQYGEKLDEQVSQLEFQTQELTKQEKAITAMHTEMDDELAKLNDALEAEAYRAQEDMAQANEDITAMRTEMEGELAALNTSVSGKAPVSHASKSNIYGPATTTNWGHVTLGSDIPQDSTAGGSAGTANGNVANANHRHRYPAQLLYSSDGIDARYALVASSTITTFRPVDAAMTNNLGATNYRYDTIYLKNNPNVSSDERLKKDIAPIDEALELVMGIEPVKFRRKDDEKTLHYGVVAQQLRDTIQSLGVFDSGLYSRDSIEEDIPNDDATEDQVRYGVYYTELIAPLIAVVQKQQKRIEKLEAAVYGQTE